MKINIYELIAGAKKAEGLAVIIDVFRAFTTACYLFANGAENVYTVSKIETALKLKSKLDRPVLVGERGGKKLKGFDFGNSPYLIDQHDFSKKEIVLTTSSGTKGIISAENAEQIITGSFVNSASVAQYIKKISPEEVSLVAMGIGGEKRAEEDLSCAVHLKNLLLGNKVIERKELIDRLQKSTGRRFFADDTQADMPEEDFYYSLDFDKFDFVLKAEKQGEDIFELTKISL
ncbi:MULTISPECIES: 2-phosphosulfolactate phosphatase [unclassified Halanaerobium]|uniref:2-phosphosulfolactate phosphatase n=1 Tax=unclassified Halanaerobium TaxID=2641197 RepID=UPI000DF4C771|nr:MULTISPECIES: 2-phosphosulfolactate phosphatase [unclassified Halanaerobium]RCW49225.1 2-phosphosulfolactate phosphatase [Halanaerobium sp. MA284_MarDTE_T2]RCW82945.1 2-phosphosulfolactate phosphatase [Halanaerobium sp. DL-01]